MQLQDNNSFKQFMIDNFIDGNEVYENIIRGANYSPANNIINEIKSVVFLCHNAFFPPEVKGVFHLGRG